jgi:hypothetical protein
MNSTPPFFKQVKSRFVFGVVIGSLLLAQCNQPSKHDEQVNGKSSDQAQSQKFWNSASITLQKITLSDSAVVRNVNWLQPLSSLNEKIELSENQPKSGKSYSLYLDDSDLNFVDVIYNTNKNNQINKIVFDIYVEDKFNAIKLLNEFEHYFSVKYGKKTTQGQVSNWESKSKSRILLEDVSTSKDPGIKIIYELID